MIGAALQRLDRSARLFVPVVLSAFLILLSALPVHVPGYGQIAVDVGLMTVFYWAIYRPDLLPGIAAFCLGLWQDILVGSPIGLHALLLLLANWAIVSQRTFFQAKSFAVVWWSFSLVAAAVAILGWIIVCLLNTTLVNPLPGLFQSALTVGVFPFMVWLLARAQHLLLPHADGA
ncbi:MAG: rod shape-determining protein MreD [Rhodospirillaceae bacterium]